MNCATFAALSPGWKLSAKHGLPPSQTSAELLPLEFSNSKPRLAASNSLMLERLTTIGDTAHILSHASLVRLSSTMRHSFPINATLILRVTSMRDAQDPLITETDQHEISRLLRYRLAVLKAALRSVDELRRKAAKALIVASSHT